MHFVGFQAIFNRRSDMHQSTRDRLTGRQVASIVGGLIIAAAVVLVLVWYVSDNLFPDDSRDPLTKARGPKAEQLR
jgi:hypothetical protein